jgi:tetratricopeptide (TPR) repeat protein
MKNRLFFLFLIASAALGQTDHFIIDQYLEQAKAQSMSQQDSAVYYTTLAYASALDTKDTLLIGQVSYFHSFYLIKKGAYVEAEKLLDFNLANSKLLNDQILGGTHYNYGNRYFLAEVYDEALANYLQSLHYYTEANNKQGLMTANLQLGVVYSKLNKEELAGYFYGQSLRYSDKAEKTHTKKMTYGKNNLSQNIAVSKAMLQELEQEPDDRIKANVLYNLGNSYFKNRQWQSASASFKKSLDLKRQLGVADQVDKNLFYIGQSYLEMGTLQPAIDYLLQARNVSEKRGQKAAIASSLQRAYEEKGDYKTALQFAKRYEQMKDSLNTLQENDRIAEITSQFETEKQAAEITLLETNNILQASKLSNQRNVIWATTLGLVLLLTALFFAYKRYQTKQKLQFSELTRKLLQMQLNPHFLFNALNGIQYFIKQNDTKKSTKYLSNFSGLMRNILENSGEKFITVEEDAETIIDFLALQQLVHNNSFLFTVHIAEDLDAENLCIPPMFTQPFVENAIVHGVQGLKEGSISVLYKLEGETITVEIKDNGKGIVEASHNANSLHKSMGTSITKQRMENLLKTENYAVTLEVVSRNEPNAAQGTTVMLTFLKKYL